jgi:crotonobetainyl-CoA:carnitine CoA-transferase CaiB-like acyl-CoA transferase
VFGAIRQVGCPIKIDDIEPRYAPGAALGADTDAILHEWLGMTPVQVAALRSAGAL